LIVFCSIIESPYDVWYIDIGASIHMSGVIEHFTDLRDLDINLEIVLGDETIVGVARNGTISFQRELI